MLKDGQLFCDNCQKPISKVTDAPAEGWPTMHNLCSDCFAQLRNQAVPRPS
jgi:hypothetical protein